MVSIDLNADVGEGVGDDAALLSIVTSANIACGGHAGDDETMRETIRIALQNGVAIGAHPSFPDRQHFGRVVMERTPEQIEADIIAQISALVRIASSEGGVVRHVKPHGALYNVAARDRHVADAIARAVRACDPSLRVVGLAGGRQRESARKYGLRAIDEVFADRRYLADGTLVPRTRPDALIDPDDERVAQVLAFVERGYGETVCVHGDTPGAVRFARMLRATLEERGVRITAER